MAYHSHRQAGCHPEWGTLGSQYYSGEGSAQTSGHPVEDSRHEQPARPRHDAGQQEHSQGQEEEYVSRSTCGQRTLQH